MAQNVIYSDVEIYILLLLLTTILHLLPFFFSTKTLSSTFPLYKVKEKSLVEQLIKNNLVLNRNKVLKARKRKQMCTVLKLEFCVSFLNGVMCSCPLLYLHDPLWTLTNKRATV